MQKRNQNSDFQFNIVTNKNIAKSKSPKAQFNGQRIEFEKVIKYRLSNKSCWEFQF